MPTTSPAQERLMQTVAHTPGGFAGVPQNVGQEFIGDAQGHAAGVMHVAPDGDILLLLRSPREGNFAGHWAWPGGGANENETPEQAADRESFEELGSRGHETGPMKVLDRRMGGDGKMAFHTFVRPVGDKFAPQLNGEHVGYAWVPMNMLPAPLHPGVQATLQERIGVAADMSPEDWGGLISGFTKWVGEEQAEPEHAGDEFKESDHPRVKGGENSGQFTSGGGGGSGGETAGTPSADEVKAIKGYTTAGYKPVNQALRGISKPDEKTRALISQMDSYLDKTGPMSAATTTYRGICCEAAQAIIASGPEPGTMITDPGFASTSRLESIASTDVITGRRNDIVMVIDLPEGARAADISQISGDDEEEEVLLGRNTSFLVKAFDPASGRLHVEARTTAPPPVQSQDKMPAMDESEVAGGNARDRFILNSGAGMTIKKHDAADQAADCALAFDRGDRIAFHLPMAGAPHRDGMAFDRATVRHEDQNGHLHVAVSNISKATINPYLGREIPKWRELGLEPERIYNLLRAADELEKAVGSFNNLPLLAEHVAVTADKHPAELVVGSTGTDAEFTAPYLRNSLVIWTRGGIEAIKSQAKKELSCAYRYRADMTPGTWEGEKYDGVMRDIVGNHVALVEEGRAGSDVVVGDSKEGIMSKTRILTRKASLLQGALTASLLPFLAQDAKLNLMPALSGVTPKSSREKAKDLATAVLKIVEPILAKDKKLSLDEVEKVIDLVNKYDDPAETGTEDAVETDPNSGMPMTASTMDADPIAKIKEFLTGKISPEDMAQLEALCAPGAADEPPPFAGKPEVGKGPNGAKDEHDDDKDKDKDETMGKDAVNLAIKVASEEATKNALRIAGEIRDAERLVRPYVGEIAVAFDSGEAVMRHALKALGVKGHDTMHKDALAAVLEIQPKPDGRKQPIVPELGQDSAAAKSFAERFPHASRIQVLG